MDNITVGQIVAAIGTISLIGGFVCGIIVAVSKWWKTRVTDKFTTIDNRFEKVEERLDDVERKRDQYEQELQNSKDERLILMKGELAALKALHEIHKSEDVSDSINEIEQYVFDKSHGVKSK